MKLIYKDSRFICESTYAEKDIPKSAGFRWDSANKYWWTDEPNKAAILNQYATPEASEVIKNINQKRIETLEASKATNNTELDIPRPEGLNYLPFQKAGIAYAKDRVNVLFADEMGLGKTIQAIGVINLNPSIKKVLVICPASLRLNWQRELTKWLVRKYSIEITGNEFPKSDIVIINYDTLGKFHDKITSIDWDIMICDESHYIKNPKAQRTINILGKWNRDPTKASKPINAKRKLFLTGTPILNRPIELWPIIHSTGVIKNWKFYTERYCSAHYDRNGWDVSGASNLEELQEKLRTSIMVRRLKKDVLTELPPKRRQVIEIPANGSEIIIKAENDFMHKLDSKLAELRAKVELAKASESDEDYRNAVRDLTEAELVAFTEMAKVRHETAVAKIPYVLNHLRDLLDSIDKLVVFAHHHDVIDAIMDEFKDIAVKLTGETSLEERQKSVDQFQNNPDIRLFVGSIKAAGVGITLTSASTAIFAELDWVPGNITQAEDRCHRIGQTNSVLIQHLVLEGSLDAKMAKTIIQKQEIIEKALDKQIDTTLKTLSMPTDTSFATHSVKREAIAIEAQNITPDEIATIHAKLKFLASICDGANSIDGMGFNKMDSRIGKDLANQYTLTAKQAVLAKHILVKYKKQLGD